MDRIRPDNDARVHRVRGDLHRCPIMAGADGIMSLLCGCSIDMR